MVVMTTIVLFSVLLCSGQVSQKTISHCSMARQEIMFRSTHPHPHVFFKKENNTDTVTIIKGLHLMSNLMDGLLQARQAKITNGDIVKDSTYLNTTMRHRS
jgi:hypothetical protein